MLEKGECKIAAIGLEEITDNCRTCRKAKGKNKHLKMLLLRISTRN